MSVRNILFSVIILAGFALSAAAASPEVPHSMEFAGEKIYFDTEDMYERMDRELLTFTYMHTTSTLMLKRAGIYFPVVEPILKEMGVPDDLKYLMVIESNLNPEALSTAGAAGLWQFMAATAKQYGLEVNTNVDERYNVELATRAACRHLLSVYEHFGSWMSVAAAYNGGMAGLDKKMSSQKQGSVFDLLMVEETSRYMFRILAAKMLFNDPKSFGFDISPAEMYRAPQKKETAIVTSPIASLVDYAIEKGTTYRALKKANLWLREDKLNNSSGKTYYIIIPGN